MRSRRYSASTPDGLARDKAPTLKASFPQVKQLRVELSFERGGKWHPSNQVHILHPPSAATFRYRCPVAGCTGHFELDLIVEQLLKRAAPTLADDVSCHGVRSEDRATGKPCALHLNYRVEATY